MSGSANPSTHNEDNKYNGLIKKSFITILREYFINLFTYLDSVVPSFFILHKIITVWRIIQFIGPCLCAANNFLWNPEKSGGKTISIISILFHIVPVEYRRDSSTIFEFIYCGINIIFFILILSSALYYRKAARLPKHLPSIISIYINTIGYLIHPVNINFVGEDIGRLIDGQTPKYNISVEVVAIIISILCFLIWFWFFDQISVVSFLFRPNSLISVLNSTQIILFVTTNLVTFILAIASQLSKTASSILTFIGALLYLIGLLSIYTSGSYINLSHKKLVFSSSITSCLFTIIMGIYIISGKKASLIEFFIFVAVLIIIYLVSSFLFNYELRKQMEILDDYQNQGITIDNFKNPNEVVKLCITGMKYSHPAILEWKLFREATEKWPKEVKIWITFGKFVAIYPQENILLSHIIYAMSYNRLKGNLAKQSITQAKSINTQRESSLSTMLKVRLNRSSKQVQVTKRKLRHIWDLAIQGSINEMESSINTAYLSVNRAQSYFNHLLSQYPNNRFVARQYHRFIQEIEGDPKKYSEWTEKVKLLQRGVSIYPDHTNLLGIHAFPNLPPNISNNNNTQPMITESESFISETVDSITDASNQSNREEINDQISIIRDHIDTLQISTTCCIKLWNILFFLVFMFVPFIAIMALLPDYLNSLSQCLDYEYYLSYIRALAVEAPIFANHYLCEQIGFYPKPLYNMKPEAYGYQNTTDEMLRFLLKEMANSVEAISAFRIYQKNNEDVKPVHEIVFGGIIPFKYYRNQAAKPSNTSSTLQGAITDIAMSTSKLIDSIIENNCSQPGNDQKCWDLQNTTDFLNPYMNYGIICDCITDALKSMNNFLQKNAKDVENLAMFICLFICIVYALIILGILVYQLDSLQRSKRVIYKCLTSLPKNVVSNISESLRMVSKNDDDETEKVEEIDSDLNKQEENILKIFTSSGDASMKSHDKTVLVAASLFLFACSLICTFILAFSFPDIANGLYNNSPHLGYILGTSGFGFSVIGAVDNLIQVTNNHGIMGSGYNFNNPNEVKTTYLKKYLLDYINSCLTTFMNYYHAGRFGAEDTSVPPYSLYESAIEDADSNLEGCEEYKNGNDTKIPKYFSCYNTDVQLNLFKSITTQIMIPIIDGYVVNYDPQNDTSFNQLWNMMTIGICNKLLYPMFDNIIPEMREQLNSILPQTRAIVIIVLILAFIDVIIIVYEISSSETKMRFALSLLTFCPPHVVLQNQSIMDILTGNFSSRAKEISSYNNEFFDSIVQSIPDSVIVCNSNFKVINVNKATERIYGIDSKNIIDQNAQEFFTSSSMLNGDVHQLFEKSNSTSNFEYKKPNEDNKSFLEINMSQMGDNHAIVTRDMTQTVLYNTLIAEERAKSDSLLSSILPPNLVKRVQDGEKNISFGVQSASILFLDIVEFTPWCASNTASMVMSTLNTLFRRFDSNLSTHATMTKIKCIGDCYMCSGGIFVEINQPAIHAKETVEFGLEAIQTIIDNNKENNLSLRIRVGVNTGGPIVAGVLGTEKPTFEILGPAINMAQQMENHGVPMKVHISRATYELIYGSNFEVKERGQIEIKQGAVLTYLVESKK